MVSILLVEDHVILANSLVAFLNRHDDLHVAAVAHTGADAVAQLPQLAVQLVLVDISLPDISGIDLVGIIVASYPKLPCLMLSGFSERIYVNRALTEGARGYVLKGNPEGLIEAVLSVLAGRIFLSKDLDSSDAQW
jgi:DNA-binding NarL/FixJ family response regulator